VRPVVTIDPGHGGHDPGAHGPGGLLEKVVVLAISRRVRDLLLRENIDARLTREVDIFLPLHARLAAPRAACFVSIHCNGFADPAAHGTEVFHFAGRASDQRLARTMQRHLLSRLGRRDRGVKAAAFRVLKQARVPAVLIELAFITNPVEEALLGRADIQEQAARAIAEAVVEYLQEGR